MLRLFFAVQTPSTILDELRRVQNELSKKLEALNPAPNFKRENLANSHCTIRFLGDVEEAKVDPLVENVAREIGQAKPSPFEAHLSSCGSFAHRGKTRVIWAGLEPANIFQELRTAVDRGLQATGIAIEDDNE